MRLDPTCQFQLVWHHQNFLLSLLTFWISSPLNYKPILFFQHTPQTSQWTTQRKNTPSVSSFNQAVIFPHKNPTPEFLIANLPTLLYHCLSWLLTSFLHKPLKRQHPQSCHTQFPEGISSIPFVRWIGQRYLITMSGSFSSKLDFEILPLHY